MKLCRINTTRVVFRYFTCDEIHMMWRYVIFGCNPIPKKLGQCVKRKYKQNILIIVQTLVDLYSIEISQIINNPFIIHETARQIRPVYLNERVVFGQ